VFCNRFGVPYISHGEATLDPAIDGGPSAAGIGGKDGISPCLIRDARN